MWFWKNLFCQSFTLLWDGDDLLSRIANIDRVSFLSPAYLIYRRIPLSDQFHGRQNFLQFPKLFHPSILFPDPSLRSHPSTLEKKKKNFSGNTNQTSRTFRRIFRIMLASNNSIFEPSNRSISQNSIKSRQIKDFMTHFDEFIVSNFSFIQRVTPL